MAPLVDGIGKLDAGWPESEEGQVGNVKLEEEVKRRSNEDNLVKYGRHQDYRQIYLDIEGHSDTAWDL